MDEHDDLRQRLRHLGSQPIDLARQSADLTAMAGVVPMPRFRSKLRLAAAFLAGLLIGSTGLAAADVLPDPAQHVAHNVLDRVGVSVPDPERYHGAECGAEVKKNHGAYVRDDHDLAKSECGKKVKPAGETDAEDEGDGPKAAKADKGPCGKPPWAKDKTMTPEAVEAAKAARALECGVDDAEGTELEDEDEADNEDPARSAVEDTATTTTVASGGSDSATTTEATTTTTASAG